MTEVQRSTLDLSGCFPGDEIELRLENGAVSRFKLLDPKAGTIDSGGNLSSGARVGVFYDNNTAVSGELVAGKRAIFFFEGIGYLPTPKIVEILLNGKLVASAPSE